MSIASAIVEGELCPVCTAPGEYCDCSPESIKSMGGHVFVALRANQRREKTEGQLRRLESMRLVVEQRNDGHHWVVRRGELRWDYWPRRQKYRRHGADLVRRGFDRMLQEILGGTVH